MELSDFSPGLGILVYVAYVSGCVEIFVTEFHPDTGKTKSNNPRKNTGKYLSFFMLSLPKMII